VRRTTIPGVALPRKAILQTATCGGVVLLIVVGFQFRALLLSLIGPGIDTGMQRRLQVPKASTAFPALPDTSSNISVGLVFNYALPDPSSEAHVTNLVWASNYTTPTGVYNTKYEQFDREPSQGTPAHNLAWFKRYHPDWVEYNCDRATVAYEFGEPYVPLDITNPAVLDYFLKSYYQPAIQKGYRGIAFDNVNLANWYGRCGHYNTSGHWVQQFTGAAGDPAYHTAILNWARWMAAHLHRIHALVSMNWSYDWDDPTDSYALVKYMDLDLDERGFTFWGTSASNEILTGGHWFANMKAIQYLTEQGKGYLSDNQYPGSFSAVTTAQKQWALANYLLIKGSHSWIYICGRQQYGHMFTMPEYWAPIGAATDAMYRSQNVYMRDFTNGKAIVNPSTNVTYTVSLPANAYKDLYGHAVGVVTLGPESGIVLLGARTSTPASRSHGQRR